MIQLIRVRVVKMLALFSAFGGIALLSLFPGGALAQDAAAQEAADDEKAKSLEEVVVGSRRAPRSVFDATSPVDVVSVETFQQNSSFDMLNLLRGAIPSLNVNTQPISDGATAVRPASLRGLSPDHTLILVNGKRRHRSSIIGWLTPGAARGTQGPDLASIPSIALKRVEVLRDGAAAQYGSDAIAGVINFVLADDSSGVDLRFDSGIYEEGDGLSWSLAGKVGVPIPFLRDGFLTISAEASVEDDTVRSVQSDSGQELIDGGNEDVRDPVQEWGKPVVSDNYKLFANFGGGFGNSGVAVYAFTSYSQRTTDGGFYFRSPDRRSGIFTRVRDSYADGVTVHSRLVGDLTPDNGVDECAGYRNVNVDDEQALASLISNPSCFVYNEWFPGGLTPRFGSHTEDYSVVAGIGGEHGRFSWDLSGGFGANKNDFFIRNTINASLGPWAGVDLGYPEDLTVNPNEIVFDISQPTTPGTREVEYDPGDYNQYERSVEFVVSYAFPAKNFASDLHVTAGVQWREEEFEITPGEVSSWIRGPLADQGFSTGSNGFPGFSPYISGSWETPILGFYVDVEADVSERLTFNGAFRWEDFDGDDDTLRGKLSGRYKLTDALSLRGTYSTGYRAPTPGQANAVNETSGSVVPGTVSIIGTIPSTDPVAVGVGGRALAPEESASASLGVALSHGDLSASVDCFQVKVWDRLALSKEIPVTPDRIESLVNAGFVSADSWDYFRFFTNEFNTTTNGCDLVASYDLSWKAGATNLTFLWNRSITEVTQYTEGGPLDDVSRIRDIQDGVPHNRAVITALHSKGGWSFLARFRHFDSWYDSESDYYFAGYGYLDLAAGYTFNFGMDLTLGVDNVLDTYPEENPAKGILGATYSQYAPGGFDGAYAYFRATYNLNY